MGTRCLHIYRRPSSQPEVITLLPDSTPEIGQIGHTQGVGTRFTFTGTVWLWQGDSPWHFVSLPEDVADEIADLMEGRLRGFGSVRVEVAAPDFTWRTSIFPDRKSGTYILPLKKLAREHLGCGEGSRVTLTLTVITD